MNSVLPILFWGSITLILYAYVGFTLVLLVRSVWRRPVRKADITPTISLVIVAHNEAATIAAKLENALASDYPCDKLQIIVASDGSDDGTDETVARFADRGVRLFTFPRQGKIPALNAAVAQATGEILALTDANSLFAPDSLSALVRPFADPAVGGVAGNQCYSSGNGNAASFGERLYWAFDRWLKSLGSRSGNVISSTGAIHAIRRDLFQPVPLGVGDDFIISTRVILQGYRLVFEPAAIARESTASSDRAEFQRKVRVIVRGLRGLWVVRALFNPIRHGFYSLQIASHKLLRWCVGWLLLVLLATSIGLNGTAATYRIALWGQVAIYGLAVAAMVLRQTPLARFRLFRLFSIPFFFCLANVAAIQAWLQLMTGKRVDAWNSNRPIAATTTSQQVGRESSLLNTASS
jgi:cellulose synthase/poly-beta-1,6-N-acetylglucosamine synthase-like glycosyltransferase